MRLHHRGMILVSCVLVGLAGPMPAQAWFHDSIKKTFEDVDKSIKNLGKDIFPESDASSSKDPSKSGAAGWSEPGTPGTDPYFKSGFNKALEFARTGSESPWSNPKTGERGTITPTATFNEAGGTPCRNYRWTLVAGASSRLFEGTACRIGASNWQVREETEQQSTVAGSGSSDTPWLSGQGTGAQGAAQQPGPATPQSSFNHDKQMVADAQRMLNQWGYSAGVVDGLYGKKTRFAIRAFQKDRGLPAGGNVTPLLVAQLSQAPSTAGASPTATATSTPATTPSGAAATQKELIREVQESLKRLGFYKGSIDGTLGRDTKRAITVFQRNAGLTRTGRPTDQLVALLRMRAKTATPHGRLLAKQGQLEAYVGPGRWCRGSIGVTIRASDPMAFYEDKNELQNVVSHLHEALQNECPRFKRANIIGIAQDKQVYTAVLAKSGELKEQISGRPVSQAGGEASVCTTADPNSFDQVFACMSSARWTRGASAGRNRFEGNIGTSDCRSIAAVYIDVLGKNGGLPRNVAVDRTPDCEIFARAVIEITGKPAYWANCVGYGSKPAQAHMKACLESFVAGYGGSTKVTDRVKGCATAIAEYEKGLKRADKNNRLPSSYTRQSCDVALAMISKWSGTVATASSCTGYDPGKVKSHVEQCFREEVKLSTLRNCGDVRRIYEERLVEAHGRLPRNYLMMPCSAATDLLARAEAERAEISAKQLAAAAKQRAIAAKQRAAAIERQRRIAERQTAANRAIEMARQRHERPTKTYNPEGRPPVAPGTETEPAGQPSIARSAQGASQTPAQPQQQSSGTTFSETLNEAARRQMAAGDGSETCPGNQVQSLKQAGLGDKRATVPLSNCNIHRFDRWTDMRSPLRVPRGFQRSLVREHGREVMEAGQKVISCTYGPSDSVTRKGFVGYTFWYEDAPDNIYSMLSSAPDIHPMWSLGLKSVTACPESPELARKVMLYGKIKKHREKGFYTTKCYTMPDQIFLWGTIPGLETCRPVWVPYRNDWILKEASELALYRKAFVSGKAREPVESKEAEYPELALYRKAFGSGKAREPVESKEAEYTVLNYGEVPENFVPQVPELPKNRRLKITMKKLFPGSLHTIKIRPFHLGMLIKGEAGYIDRPQIQQMVREDLFAVMQSRSPVLECKYRSYRKLGPHYDYWYKNRPVTADPGRLKSRVSDHPLLFIRSPLESCPASREEAINYK